MEIKNNRIKVKCLFIILMAVAILGTAPPLIYAAGCYDIENYLDVPCEIITPNLTCSDDAIIIYTVNNSNNQTVLMNNIDSGIYNFSFNYTELGSYKITICDGTYTIVNVVEDRVSQSTSITNYVGATFTGDLNTTIKEQVKVLARGYIDWIGIIFLRFWWIIAFIAIGLLIWAKKKKKVIKQ